jgi:hypothetical protein
MILCNMDMTKQPWPEAAAMAVLLRLAILVTEKR